MKPVKDLLSRFKKLTPPDQAVRRAVAEAISEIARVPVTLKEISIKNSVAFVKCSSIARNVIYSKRPMILAALMRNLPRAERLIRDVR
jgi:hypothetical protein